MTVVSSKEFIKNEDKYFDLALDEDIFVRKDKVMFIVARANETKRFYQEPDEERMRTKKQTSIQELILQAPTWTDEEYNDYLDVKKHIHQSRLQ